MLIVLLTGTLHIVMERAEDGDLATLIASRLQQRRYMSEDQILNIFVQICLALWHVHREGVLHRDLKAQNVFLGKHDVIKLGDFGIASRVGRIADLGAAPPTMHSLVPGA